MDVGTLATVALWILAVALVGIGLAGLALPALPGAPLLFAGLPVSGVHFCSAGNVPLPCGITF